MNHDCSTKAVFLCTAVQLQSYHMLAHWTDHTGPLNFRGFGDHGVSLLRFPIALLALASHDRRYNESNIGGFNGCSHVGTLNSAYWPLSAWAWLPSANCRLLFCSQNLMCYPWVSKCIDQSRWSLATVTSGQSRSSILGTTAIVEHQP